MFMLNNIEQEKLKAVDKQTLFYPGFKMISRVKKLGNMLESKLGNDSGNLCILQTNPQQRWDQIVKIGCTNLERRAIVGFPWPIYIMR
jgi:hypothetical protein